MKFTGKTFWLVLTAALTLQAGSVMADSHVRAAIEARNVAWAEAYNAGDAAAVAALYEEDATLMPPGMANAVGRAAIEAVLPEFFAVMQSVRLRTESVIEAGDYAFEIGHVHYTSVDADGAEAPATDRYAVAWHKGEDGVWRLAVDIITPGWIPPAAE